MDVLGLATVVARDDDRRAKLQATYTRIHGVSVPARGHCDRNGRHAEVPQRSRATQTGTRQSARLKRSAGAPSFDDASEEHVDVFVGGRRWRACVDLRHKPTGRVGRLSRAVRSAAVAFEEWCERGESSGGDGLEETEPYDDAARHWERPQPASQSA